jgi:hypothetical protein
MCKKKQFKKFLVGKKFQANEDLIANEKLRLRKGRMNCSIVVENPSFFGDIM